jgi:two-component system chemotaxis response regulator CheY
VDYKEGFVRALVVDDSRAMRAILRRILRGLGYEVLEAGNGREGLECLRKFGAADLALVDWNMPEMNGLDFLRALRKERTYDAMRVMMVTTETEMEEVTEALGVGASEYVMKPFTKEVIVEKLQILGLVQC